MNDPEPAQPPISFCPVCKAPVDPTWMICTKCAANVKRDTRKNHHALWFAILPVFVIAEAMVALNNVGSPIGSLISIGLIFGLPLAWLAGNAVLNLLKVSPQAGRSTPNATVRFWLMAFVVFIVVPTMLVVSVVAFAFVVCAINV